ncbi:hypothetical protein BCR35DRAFT_335134 [Leucosporidium creatinivorum]|uniref:Zn(2)-C6 fungal-type domain-containing protein n=1 Tax=Leucosporidium creatinivorum TaxID=106004 RepID=A0A1Y2DII4_9BASI|nr:hypothetical protein BCR35DRAFT_335134 [Leucosporidium creatinivorum]
MGVNLAAGALREWTRVISCESCRIKKLKCDRVIGGCSNCRSRGHTCSYAGHPPTQHMDTVGLSALERNRQKIERLRTTMTSLVGKLGLSEQDVVSIQLDAEARYGVHVFQRTRPADPLAPPPLATLRRQGVTSQPRPPPPPPSMPPSILHRPQPSTNAPPRPYYTQMALGPPKINRHPPSSKPPPAPPQQPQQHQHRSLPSPAFYSTTYTALASRPPVHPHLYRPSPKSTLTPRVATARVEAPRAPPQAAATPQFQEPVPTPQAAAPRPPPLAPLKFAPARPPTSAPSKVGPPPPPVAKTKLPPPPHSDPQHDPENIIHRRGSDATVEVLYADGEFGSPLLKPKLEPEVTTIDSSIA